MKNKIYFFLLAAMPSLATASSYSNQIRALAAQSACSQYSWYNRGL
jgi:hypothetical protein